MMGALTVAAEGPGAERQAAVTGQVERSQVRLTVNDLCATYSALICRFAAMAAGTDLEADDLAQEALLKAVRGLDRFDPTKGSIDGWLWRIVANVARDFHRARARRLALWRRLAERWHEPTETVEDRALQSIPNQELISAVRSLHERDRMVIALRFGADLDLTTVGAAVGLSADTAGQVVLRALARLRNHLEVSR